MRFATFIERMTIEEKLTFITSSGFVTNVMPKFNIPTLRILTNEEIEQRILPANVGVNSIDVEVIKEHAEYLKKCLRGMMLLRIDMNDFYSDHYIISKKALEIFVNNNSQKIILDFTKFDHSLENWNHVLKDLNPSILLLNQNQDLSLFKGSQHKLMIVVDNPSDILNAIKEESIFTICKNSEYKVEDLHIKHFDEKMLDERVNDLLEIISRTAEENAVDNLANYQTKNETNYLEDQISFKTSLESIVLIKNEKHLLPLKNKKVLVAGNLTGTLSSSVNYSNFYEACKDNNIKIVDKLDNVDDFILYKIKTVEFDSIILFIDNLDAGYLRDLLVEIHEAKKHVILCLNQKDINNFKLNIYNLVDAFLYYKNYGSAVPVALAQILSGKVNPTGKLLYAAKDNKKVILPFGFGLDYTHIKLTKFDVSLNNVHVIFKNHHGLDINKPVFVFSSGHGHKEAVGFGRVYVKSHNTDNGYIAIEKEAYNLFVNDKTVIISIGDNLIEMYGQAELELIHRIPKVKEDEIIYAENQEMALVDFKYDDPNKLVLEDKEGLSSKKKALIGFILIVYFDLMCYFAMATGSTSQEANSLIYLAMGAVTIFGMIFVFSKLTNKKRNARKKLNQFMTSLGEFKQVYNVSYDKPVEQQADEEVKKEEYIYHEDDTHNYSEKKENTDIEDFDIENLAKKFILFSKERGVNVEMDTVRNLFSCMASSNLVLVSTYTKEEVYKLENVISAFFGVELCQTEFDEINSEKDLYWKFNNFTNEYKMNGLAKSISIADKLSTSIIPTFLNNVKLQDLKEYFDVHLKSIQSNIKNNFVSIEEKEMPLHKNIWYFVVLNEESEIPNKFIENGMLMEINLQEHELYDDGTVNELSSVKAFNTAVNRIKQEHFISESYWKKLDEFIESVSNIEDFSISNKEILQLEKFSSVYKSSSLDDDITLDIMFKNKIVPMIKNMNFYKSDRGEKIVHEIILKAFGEDLLAKSNKALAK